MTILGVLVAKEIVENLYFTGAKCKLITIHLRTNENQMFEVEVNMKFAVLFRDLRLQLLPRKKVTGPMS